MARPGSVRRCCIMTGVNGKLMGDRQPWKGSAADLFVQAQFRCIRGASWDCRAAS